MSPASLIFHLLMILSCRAEDNSTSDGNNSTLVQTSYGLVQGRTFTSPWTNKTIYAFQGIPYAAPPVGSLRFKDPVPPEKWTTVKDCTTDAPSCFQAGGLLLSSNSSLIMEEDCLYLNVYTPEVRPEGELLPVMVWIHGGGFVSGSGSYTRYGPDFFVGDGVVVVTLNYRLGALGFLTLGTADAPGNAALKDQLLALKWVHSEIHQFGGNPDNVTLFGESAGSASVHLHYLSPLSKGLFHRVIGESGAALCDWAVRDNGQDYGVQLATLLKCNTSDMVVITECLLAADPRDIIRVQGKVQPTQKDLDSGRTLIFIPSIDNATSAEPFLPAFPEELVEQGQGSNVPFIMGINSDEGMMRISNETKVKNVTNNLEPLIPYDVRKSCTPARLKELTERIKLFYFNNTTPSLSNLRGYVDLFTDTMFGYSTAVSARTFLNRGDVYLYYFSFNGAFKEKIVIMLEHMANFSGVSHAEEMNYLFVRGEVNQTADQDSNEMTTWRRMVRMWTNFAKYGTPTVGEDPILQNVGWSPIRKDSTHYLHIDVNLTMVEEDFLGPRVALWDSLSPSASPCLPAPALAVAATSAVLYTAK